MSAIFNMTSMNAASTVDVTLVDNTDSGGAKGGPGGAKAPPE